MAERILVACEFTGVVRDAFARRGWDAWSCDLEPTEVEGQHYQCDVREVLGLGWDMMIAFPPCTYLAASGMHWNKRRPQRAALTDAALDFVCLLAHAPIPRIAIENPVGCISTRWRKPDQIIQPWQFGHRESKATCFWLKGLPLLVPTREVLPNYLCRCGFRFPQELGKYGCPNCCGDNGPARHRWDNQTPSGQNRLSSSRAKDRSRTYPGIAEAMAQQWGLDGGRDG